MELDTLNSIAVKFETTPAELARLNKKPLGPTSTVFTGEVSIENSSISAGKRCPHMCRCCIFLIMTR
jgi:hypothetical protein